MGVEDAVAIVTGVAGLAGIVFGFLGWRASRAAQRTAVAAIGISQESLALAQRVFDLEHETRIDIEHTRVFDYQHDPPKPYVRVSAVNAGRPSILAVGIWLWNATDKIEHELDPSKLELNGEAETLPCLLARGQLLYVYYDANWLLEVTQNYSAGATCEFQLFDENERRYSSRFPWTRESLVSEINSMSLAEFNQLIRSQYRPTSGEQTQGDA